MLLPSFSPPSRQKSFRGHPGPDRVNSEHYGKHKYLIRRRSGRDLRNSQLDPAERWRYPHLCRPSDGSTPVLYFSPDLTNILTPTPAGGLTLDPSTPSVFTVGAVQPAAFTIVVTDSVEFPPSFPSGSSTTLSFQSLADYQQMPPIVGTSFDPPVKSGS